MLAWERYTELLHDANPSFVTSTKHLNIIAIGSRLNVYSDPPTFSLIVAMSLL